jgi:hypothetical protein
MRTTLRTRTGAPRAAVAVVAATAALGLTACSDTAGSEEGADVADVVEEEPLDDFDGPYDSDFADDIDDYEGTKVTLSADVNEVITPDAFTIAGTDDTTVEALLVVGAEQDDELAPETTVEVTGTVHDSFVLADVEEELGDLGDDALFADWEEEPYVVADDVEVLEHVD